jgi:hypothetical protein
MDELLNCFNRQEVNLGLVIGAYMGSLHEIGVVWCSIPLVIWHARKSFIETRKQPLIRDLVCIPICWKWLVYTHGLKLCTHTSQLLTWMVFTELMPGINVVR